MDSSAEILKRAAVTLEKYKKNKTMVSPKDLAGKYKIPFQKLKEQLAGELSDYMKAYALERLILTTEKKEAFKEFTDATNRIFQSTDMGKRIGKAVFKEFDLELVKRLAEVFRIQVHNEAWVPYFHKHTCLYVTDGCVSENPLIPRIYNSLVDKFWDEENQTWTTDEASKEPAILFYVQEGMYEQK